MIASLKKKALSKKSLPNTLQLLRYQPTFFVQIKEIYWWKQILKIKGDTLKSFFIEGAIKSLSCFFLIESF